MCIGMNIEQINVTARCYTCRTGYNPVFRSITSANSWAHIEQFVIFEYLMPEVVAD
jgi:hypothetical protein